MLNCGDFGDVSRLLSNKKIAASQSRKTRENHRKLTAHDIIFDSMCIELYESIETLRLEINGPFVKLCDLMGTSSKIFITDKSVDVFSGGKEFDLHPRHDP